TRAQTGKKNTRRAGTHEDRRRDSRKKQRDKGDQAQDRQNEDHQKEIKIQNCSLPPRGIRDEKPSLRDAWRRVPADSFQPLPRRDRGGQPRGRLRRAGRDRVLAKRTGRRAEVDRRAYRRASVWRRRADSREPFDQKRKGSDYPIARRKNTAG